MARQSSPSLARRVGQDAPPREVLAAAGRRVKDAVARRFAQTWRALDALLNIHRVSFQWVRGHAGHVENERCDVLARQAAQGRNLPADEGYGK